MLPPPPISTLFPYTTPFRSIHFQLFTFLGSIKRKLILSSTNISLASCCSFTPEVLLIRSKIRSEEHTSELQSLRHLVCRLLLEKKKKKKLIHIQILTTQK